MKERQWWSSHVKPRWHKPEKGWVAWKVEDAYNGGLPDVDVCFKGAVAKIELKYEAAWPARPNTPLWFSELDKVTKNRAIVSAKQFNHLEQWRKAGGTALVLIGVGKEWVLLEHGLYDNVPMTKEALLAAAVVRNLSDDDVPATYDMLSFLPPFIIEHYGHGPRNRPG